MKISKLDLRGYSTVSDRKIKQFLKIFSSVNTAYNEINLFRFYKANLYYTKKKLKIFLICFTCFLQSVNMAPKQKRYVRGAGDFPA